jgi:hypothetical protein
MWTCWTEVGLTEEMQDISAFMISGAYHLIVIHACITPLCATHTKLNVKLVDDEDMEGILCRSSTDRIKV